MRGPWRSCRFWWSENVWVDLAAVAGVTAVHLVAVYALGFGDLLGRMTDGRRVLLYTTTASVAAFIFGFATASITFFYSSTAGHRVSLLQAEKADELRRNWSSVLGAPLSAVGLCLLALVLDVTKADHGGVRWLAEIALLILAVRLVRLRWLFVTVLSLRGEDERDPPTAPAPRRRERETVGSGL